MAVDDALRDGEPEAGAGDVLGCGVVNEAREGYAAAGRSGQAGGIAAFFFAMIDAAWAAR